MIKYSKGYKYQLQDDYIINLSELSGVVREGVSVAGPFLALYPAGALVIQQGYAWDGCSGPTVDTKNNMRGGLVHDALFQLMRQGVLTIAFFPIANRIFHRILREDGMSRFRAWLYYRGVKTRFAKQSALPKNKKKIYKAP